MKAEVLLRVSVAVLAVLAGYYFVVAAPAATALAQSKRKQREQEDVEATAKLTGLRPTSPKAKQDRQAEAKEQAHEVMVAAGLENEALQAGDALPVGTPPAHEQTKCSNDLDGAGAGEARLDDAGDENDRDGDVVTPAPQPDRPLLDDDMDLSFSQLTFCSAEAIRAPPYTRVTLMNLSNNALEAIPDEIGLLVALQELYLQYNKLTTLPDTVGLCRDLKELDIKNNALVEVGQWISGLDQLESLNLTNNEICILPDELCELTQMHTLYLHNNNLQTLPNNIGRMESLEVLYLGSNNALSELPDSIGQLEYLEHLDVSECNLSTLPESFCSLSSLQKLYLSENVLRALPMQMGRLKALAQLFLQSNLIQMLPASLVACENLYSFNVSNNPFGALDMKAMEEEYGTEEAPRIYGQ